MGSIENPTDRVGARITLTTEHSQAHGGNLYTAVAYEKLNAGSALTFFIIAPPVKEGHFVFSVEADGPGMWTLSRLTDASGGTAIVSQNHYPAMQDTRPDTAVFTYNALVTSTGTIMERGLIGAAGKFSIVGGDDGAGRPEWIFEDSEEAILVFTADLASTRTVIHSLHYEIAEPE